MPFYVPREDSELPLAVICGEAMPHGVIRVLAPEAFRRRHPFLLPVELVAVDPAEEPPRMLDELAWRKILDRVLAHGT